jgi:hypothetical protein
MAVNEYEPVTEFSQWYVDYKPTGSREGNLEWRGMAPCAERIWREFTDYKTEMDARVSGYPVLERLAANEVISPKPDLPNISSGETSGLIRRIARNLVQNTPNVEVVGRFDDDDTKGLFIQHTLKAKIIGDDLYSNDMQQNLYASAKVALTLGFAAVVPALVRDKQHGWHMKYDTIHYRDVFPEYGVKDIRNSPVVFVRRYLTRGEVAMLVRNNAPGWDIQALKRMMETLPPVREEQSVAHQDKKHRILPKGYEVITRYDNTGDHFLTFERNSRMLLRIERNKHPQGLHPVHFLVLEKDDQQPLGLSQVEPLIGRQDFQDLMLNGAMKLWYRNINPSILGFGTNNAIPNLSPGKYTQISNPNAKVEAFEVNTQTLMQFSAISRDNLGAMLNLVGAPDQQMMQAAGSGMSATPQGVDAQAQVVDITTNNFQKAIESFFSHYCSYALTVYFHELAAVTGVQLTADARQKLLEAGLDPKEIKEDGTLDIDFKDLAREYWVRCVPGSLVEMEDEKQLRILNQLFVPLSQAMPAIASTGDRESIGNAVKAMNYIIGKQIELSGSSSARDIGLLWKTGDAKEVNARDAKIAELEGSIEAAGLENEVQLDLLTQQLEQQAEQMRLMRENMDSMMQKTGVIQQEQPAPQAIPA